MSAEKLTDSLLTK